MRLASLLTHLLFYFFYLTEPCNKALYKSADVLCACAGARRAGDDSRHARRPLDASSSLAGADLAAAASDVE